MTAFLSVILAFSVLMNVIQLAVASHREDEIKRLNAKLEDGEVIRPREAHGDAPVMMQRLRQDR